MLIVDEAEQFFQKPGHALASNARTDLRILDKELLPYVTSFPIWDELMSYWLVNKLFLISYRTRLF